MLTQEEKIRIDSIVRSHLTGFANGFSGRHIGEMENPEGVINLKKQNIFINKLPVEFMYYSALVRSFDSSFGSVLEGLALEIARTNYQVSQKVIGQIDSRQRDLINDILTSYKNRTFTPEVRHYADYHTTPFSLSNASHASDHLLFDEANNTYHIIELKASGYLDIKKSEVEKRALLEQYFILKNGKQNPNIKLHFAAAYNRFGEGNNWIQPTVESFFAREELLIGKDFWNFVCKDENGFDAIIEAYNSNLHIITHALEAIKEAYGI